MMLVADTVEVIKDGESSTGKTGRGGALSVASGNKLQVVKVGGGNIPEIFVRRQRKQRWVALQMFICIALPTLLAGIYYGMFASGRYVSETYLMVSTSAPPSAGGGGGGLLESLAMGGGANMISETFMLYEYIKSPDIVEKLDETLDLRSLYGAPEIDVISRLPEDASREEFIEYVLDHIRVVGDPERPVLKVAVEAYTAEQANRILTHLFLFSEDMLNNAFERKRRDTISFARDELKDAEQRLAIARDKLTAFRQKYGELDPLQGAQMTSGIVGSIAQQLTTDRVKLEGMLSYFKPDSPQVMTQKAVIGALERELELQRETLTGAGDGSTYTKLLTEYQNLSIEEEFAVNAYTSALSFLKLSRNEAQRQQSYVSAFMPPTLPEKASLPNVPKEILLVFIGALLIYTVLALIITTIREQARL